MWPRFEQSLSRHKELEQLLGDPDVIADRTRYTQVAKEHGALAKMVNPYLEYLQLVEDVAQAESMLAAETDPEMRSYAEEELAGLQGAQRRR